MAIRESYRGRREGRLRVSVVVPVFNPGELVDVLIASLDQQSLRPRRFEAIFVDDGSTDDSLQRLKNAASARSYMSVISIPNSGWPGRPRNVGTDHARGKYVFFADQDDEIFPEALERMCDMADRNASDIVYGKIVRPGAQTPYWTWGHGDIDKADLLTDPVLSSRTVHKLFRRAFVADNGLRFLEGRVRLEDHHFMGQALAANPTMSVLASYPCYRWIDRRDGTNNSSQSTSVESYLGYWTGALDVLRERGASPELVTATAATAIGQLFTKVIVSRFTQHEPRKQDETFALLSPLARHSFPAEIDDRLPVLKRLRLQALRAGDQQAFLRVQQFKESARHVVNVIDIRQEGAAFRVGVQGALVLPDGSAAFSVNDEGETVLEVPDLGDGYDRRLLAADRPIIEITVRHRKIGTEWHIASDTGHIDEASCSGVIDPANAAFGRRLDEGIWNVLIRASFLGEGSARWSPLEADALIESLPIEVDSEARKVTAVCTTRQTLALKIKRKAAAVGGP